MILLDTHVVVWLASDPGKLSRTARGAIREASHAGGTAISAITLWELAWLMTNGRLDISGTVEAFIGATALAEGMALVTKDRNIRRCKQVKTIW